MLNRCMGLTFGPRNLSLQIFVRARPPKRDAAALAEHRVLVAERRQERLLQTIKHVPRGPGSPAQMVRQVR